MAKIILHDITGNLQEADIAFNNKLSENLDLVYSSICKIFIDIYNNQLYISFPEYGISIELISSDINDKLKYINDFKSRLSSMINTHKSDKNIHGSYNNREGNSIKFKEELNNNLKPFNIKINFGYPYLTVNYIDTNAVVFSDVKKFELNRELTQLFYIYNYKNIQLYSQESRCKKEASDYKIKLLELEQNIKDLKSINSEVSTELEKYKDKRLHLKLLYRYI